MGIAAKLEIGIVDGNERAKRGLETRAALMRTRTLSTRDAIQRPLTKMKEVQREDIMITTSKGHRRQRDRQKTPVLGPLIQRMNEDQPQH